MSVFILVILVHQVKLNQNEKRSAEIFQQYFLNFCLF